MTQATDSQPDDPGGRSGAHRGRGTHETHDAPRAGIRGFSRTSPDPQSLVQIVAIDGPSGAGKSTVARSVANQLGWRFLDTGAMYRAVAWSALERGVVDADGVVVAPAGGVERLLADLDLDLAPDGTATVGGRDVTEAIRGRAVERAVSGVASIAAVRAGMVQLQRHLARRGCVVAEGRDMATVVFPAARFQYFLDASLGARARRRYADFVERGRQVDLATVRDEIARRDELDRTRSDGPLRRADKASVIDSDSLTADEVVARVVSDVRRSGLANSNEEPGA